MTGNKRAFKIGFCIFAENLVVSFSPSFAWMFGRKHYSDNILTERLLVTFVEV